MFTLRGVAFQPELFYKVPSTKKINYNMKLQWED